MRKSQKGLDIFRVQPQRFVGVGFGFIEALLNQAKISSQCQCFRMSVRVVIRLGESDGF